MSLTRPTTAGGHTLVSAPADGPVGRTFTFADPDGYQITLHDRARPQGLRRTPWILVTSASLTVDRDAMSSIVALARSARRSRERSRMEMKGLLAAARNAWALTPLGGGVEPEQATPSATLYELPHAHVVRMAPAADQLGDPVLLVTPLAVPVSCWDLRPGQSLAARLAGVAPTSIGPGRPTYTIDYGAITFADRAMGFEDWVDGILPTAIRRISQAHGGAPVHLVGWSHGGTMSLLTAAHDPMLPIGSVTGVGTPTDYARNPAYAAVFWAHQLTGLRLTFGLTALLGGTTAPLTRLGYRWMAPVRELTKPWSLLRNLDDTEVLARIGAVDRFIAAMPGYPGRFFLQAIGRIVVARELVTGQVHLSEDVFVDMSRLVVPTLLIGSTDDILANAASVEAGVTAYRNAEVAFVGVSGLSHLGLISSPRARQLTWPAIDRHLAAHDRPRAVLRSADEALAER